MIKSYALFLLTILLFSSRVSLAQVPLPPTNLQIDPMTLLATWDAPESVLLDENFEADTLPANWLRTSQGQGWDLTSDGILGLIPIPGHTQYMITNDGSAGTTNNGCCDYLVTPALDLTAYPGYHLSFQSFFTGNYGQKAYVEMSTDNGATWSNLNTLNPYPIWKEINIDLSSYSGPGGLASVRFAFHADDQGNQASGWAVDDVKINSDSLGVVVYNVYRDSYLVGTANDTFWQFDPSLLTYATSYLCCITAQFSTGSAGICEPFTNTCLQPPQNFSAVAIGDTVLFTWSAPVSYNLPLMGYNLYRDNQLYVSLPPSDTSFIRYCAIGECCMDATAFYDLTPVGLPGTSESFKVSACGYVDSGFNIPFEEDWSSGQLGLNKWTAGPNWVIDGQVGMDAPSVKFTPPPGRGYYQQTLASWFIDATGFSECSGGYKIGLRYQLRLQDNTGSGTEKLKVQIANGNELYTVAEYTNTGSFDWLQLDIPITWMVRGTNFQVLFVASGTEGGNAVTWNIDNINTYFAIVCGPNPFDVNIQRLGTPENDLLISWEIPQINSMEYLMDDGSAEDQLGLEQAGETWFGNEFPVTETGVLQKASVFIAGMPGSSGSYTIDIFDSNKNYTGSSDPFVPVSNGWTDVYLPDIPFNQTFYAMLHIQTTGFSDKLGIDTNGPNAPAGYAWRYDGTVWNKITELGLQPGVFMIRTKALVGDNKIIQLHPSTQGTQAKAPGNSLPKEEKALTGPDHPAKSAAVQLPCDTIGYSIYRRGYSAYPPGSYTGNGVWEWIGMTPVNIRQFLDRDLSNDITNCYEYGITVLYRVGESLVTGTAWDCIFVGLPELKTGNMKAYPNPADKWVRLEPDKNYSHGKVFSITGMELDRFEMNGRQSVILDTSRYSPGAYIVRFMSEDGSSVCQKIMVQH